MIIQVSAKLKKELKKIKNKDKKLFKKIEKQLNLFSNNPKHTSLRLHKLSGDINNIWSISIDKKIRMVYILIDKNIAYFFDVGSHNKVYK